MAWPFWRGFSNSKFGRPLKVIQMSSSLMRHVFLLRTINFANHTLNSVFLKWKKYRGRSHKRHNISKCVLGRNEILPSAEPPTSPTDRTMSVVVRNKTARICLYNTYRYRVSRLFVSFKSYCLNMFQSVICAVCALLFTAFIYLHEYTSLF